MPFNLEDTLKKNTTWDSEYRKIKLVRQLGREGRDSITYETSNRRALKSFRPEKSINEIYIEYTFLSRAAAAGVSPANVKWNPKYKYILMNKLDVTLGDYIAARGELSVCLQKNIIDIFKTLDKLGIFHADPNPYNFMISRGRIYIIDFGFASENFNKDNMKYMPTGLVLYLKQLFPDKKFSHLEKYAFVS